MASRILSTALLVLILGCQSATAPTTGRSFVITSPANGSTSSESVITVSGTAPSNAEVVHDISLAPDNRTLADAAGDWTIRVELDEGPNVLTFRLGDDESTQKQILVTLSASTPAPAASPSPSTAPTSTPTPSPTAVGTADLGADLEQYLAFLDHVAGVSPTLAAHAQRIADLASEDDIRGLRREADSALDTTEAELSWLRENPAAPCYREVHEAYRQAISRYAEAFDAIQFGLTPPVSLSDIERGAQLMTEATELLEVAGDMIETLRCL